MRQKTLTFIAIMLMTLSSFAQTEDSIDASNMVVTYDYTCHTTDKNGKKVDDHFRFAVLVGSRTTLSAGYLCQKATAKVRGREWTVWYTEEVPTTAGPWCLYGCPGLIVKAEADGIQRLILNGHHFKMTLNAFLPLDLE